MKDGTCRDVALATLLAPVSFSFDLHITVCDYIITRERDGRVRS